MPKKCIDTDGKVYYTQHASCANEGSGNAKRDRIQTENTSFVEDGGTIRYSPQDKPKYKVKPSVSREIK
jgi:hypothetical protein